MANYLFKKRLEKQQEKARKLLSTLKGLHEDIEKGKIKLSYKQIGAIQQLRQEMGQKVLDKELSIQHLKEEYMDLEISVIMDLAGKYQDNELLLTRK